MSKLPVVEIFQSIQGEGQMMGFPTVFIRLGGCNLTCPWCDTKDSWKQHPLHTVEEIMNKVTEVNKDKASYVVITGGEPLLHDLKELIDKLHENDFAVGLETNGTKEVKYAFDFIAVAPKPQTGYECVIPFDVVDEIKYVVDEDFHWNKKNVQQALEFFEGPIFLQPQGFDMKNSIERCKELLSEASRNRYPHVRMGIQLHKIVEVQ